MEKYLDDAVYIMVTKESYDLLQKYKEEELKSNPAHFGAEPIEDNPFFHNGLEFRLLCMRAHLLTALGFAEGRKGWKRGQDFIDNDIVLRGTDNEFMNKIEELNPTINFTLQ